MTEWPANKLVIKNCKYCGTEMECTPTREVCSKCRRKNENAGSRRRSAEKKMAARVAPENPECSRTAA